MAWNNRPWTWFSVMQRSFFLSQWKRKQLSALINAHPTMDMLNQVPIIKSAPAWLAQLVEQQSAVRKVEGSSPRPGQHSGVGRDR